MALGATALLAIYACSGSPNPGGVAAQSLATDQAGTPVVVSCEAHQRALVRPAVINGAAVSQVECVSTLDPQPAPVAAPPVDARPAAAYVPADIGHAPQPVVYAPPVAAAPAPVPAPRPVYDDLEDARVVRTSGSGATPVRTRQVVYEERQPTRSTARSAVIIGSSAGAGAGVGAMIGGKKGALIGAAIGGGGATVWDQATRRK